MDLTQIKGIGEVKAIELISALEFGKRIFLGKDTHTKKRLSNAKSIWQAMKYLFYNKK